MIEVGGPDRIEPRRGLVEEHNLGVERKGPCKPGALTHAAGQLGREFMRGARRKTDHRELKEGEIVHHRLRQLEMLAHRHLDVLKHRERRKQSPSWNKMPQRFSISSRSCGKSVLALC